ncbi:MAG: AraC family transcriptional regulator [Rubripirellula sp.]
MLNLFEVDPVANLLDKLYLPSWVAAELSFGGRWGLEIPNHTVAMYVFLEGGGWLVPEAAGAEPVRLRAGDHVITTRATPHLVLRDIGNSCEPIEERIAHPTFVPADVQGRTTFLYGQFKVDRVSQNPLDMGLPDIVHLNHRRDPSLEGTLPLLDLISNAKRQAAPGWQVSIRRMAEVVFLQTIAAELSQRVQESNANTSSGAFRVMRAATDIVVGPILKEIVTRPEDPWSVPQMAKMASVSRSAFSERFRNLVGRPPLQYLTDLRMQKACRLLRESKTDVSDITSLVGYESPSSFSNAFRRWSGQSPVEYRRGGAR